jgi:hypothetical protein
MHSEGKLSYNIAYLLLNVIFGGIFMALEFKDDAICLSGKAGSKIKSELIGRYYPFWWNITSGGDSTNHKYHTAIVELDAATGEMFIKDTNEIILGSSGHALALKCDSINTRDLKIILVEKNVDCYSHLKKVITKRWKKINVAECESINKNFFSMKILIKQLK